MKKPDPKKSYLGRLCHNNHSYNEADCSLRLISTRACIECQRERQLQPEYIEKRRQHYLRNKDQIKIKLNNEERKEYYREYYQLNKDSIKEKAKEKRRKEREGREVKQREKKEKSPVNLDLRTLYYRVCNRKRKEAKNAKSNS